MNGKLTRSFGWFCLILAALLVGFYFPWLFGLQSYYMSDHTYYFEPFSNFIADGLRRGELPLWNPYLYCGMAQAAVPSPGIFYPAVLLFTVMSFTQGVAAMLCLQQFIAGCGGYLLVASLGWGVLAASVCGFAIALCGYMFSLTSNYTLVATASWIPILFFIVRNISRMWTRGNIGWMFAGAICMFCMVAAGRPEVFFPGALLLVAYVVVTAFGAYREDRMPRQALTQASLRLVSLGLGCVMALPVVLPAVEWMRLSPRSHGLDLQWVLMWSANWYDILGMLCAQPLGDITVLNSPFLNLVASRHSALPYISSAYVGPVIFTLAIWSLFDRNWRWRWAVLAVLVGFTIMACGSYTPVAPFICKLSPIFAAFRYPIKLLAFPVFCLALMAARGAQTAIDKEVRPAAELCTTALWVVLGAIGMLLWLAPELNAMAASMPWYHGQKVNISAVREALEVLQLFGRSLVVTGGLGLLVNANYFAYRKEQLTKLLFALLTGGTLLLTLFMPAVAYQRHGTVADFYRRQHPLATTLQALITRGKSGKEQFVSRVQPLYHDPLTLSKNFSARQGLDFQYSFYLFTRELMLPNTNVDFKIPYAFGYEAAEEDFYKRIFSRCLGPCSQNLLREKDTPANDWPMARFCQMTSTGFVLSQKLIAEPAKDMETMDPKLFTLVEENDDSNYRVYKVNSIFPRAYFGQHLRWNATQDQFSMAMTDKISGKLLEETFVSGSPIAGIADGAATASDTAVITEERGDGSTVQTHTSEPRLLVLTDRLYPGWIATIDGQPVEMRTVNFFARGLVVPKGTHTVSFAYRPLSVWLGIAAFGISLLFFGIAWVFGASSPRRNSTQEFVDQLP